MIAVRTYVYAYITEISPETSFERNVYGDEFQARERSTVKSRIGRDISRCEIRPASNVDRPQFLSVKRKRARGRGNERR